MRRPDDPDHVEGGKAKSKPVKFNVSEDWMGLSGVWPVVKPHLWLGASIRQKQGVIELTRELRLI
jgi:hypothetical protein